MDNYQIEEKVERMIDRLDDRFMSDSNTMTQGQYDAEVRKIDQWANDQFDLNAPLDDIRPGGTNDAFTD